MEQDRFYLRVGLFVTVLVTAAIYVISDFIVSGRNEDYTTYAIYFSGSVDGLGLGSQVRLKGITVGNVKKITFSPHESDKVLVLVNILKGAPIRNDTVATTQVLGITGTSYIALTYTGDDPKPKEKNPDDPYPVIASRPSSLEKVFNSIPDVLEELKKIIVRGEALLSDDNIATLNHTLKSVDSAAVAIDATANSLKSLVSSNTSRSFSGTFQDVSETLVEAKLALREFRMLMRMLREDPSLILHGVKHEGKKLP